MLDDILRGFADKLPPHTELRAQRSTTRHAALLGGSLVSNVRSGSGGVCARTYKNGVFGFSCAPSFDNDAIRSVLTKAEDNAAFLDSRVKKGRPPVAEIPSGELVPERDYIDVPQDRYIDFAKAVDSYIAGKYPSLASRSVSCRSNSMEKLLYTSAGGFSHQIMPRAYLVVSLSAESADGSGTIDVYDILGGGDGYLTDYYTDPAQWYERIDRLYESLRLKTEGVFPEAGVCDCIIASSLAGMLAHEAVGHTTEADLVLAGSVSGPLLGKQVASPLISMTDFAFEAFGKRAPLPVFVDDEGTPCRDVEIIKDGVLKGFMTSLETSLHFDGMGPTGNARAFAFSDEPLVRMRNTCVLPGHDKFEDMLASVDNGYLLMKSANGQADTTGEFMFGITEGFEIKHGKLGRALRDTTISGVAFDMLKTVDMVSDEISWDTAGYCGKKQPMPVSMGGPSIRCRVNIGGR